MVAALMVVAPRGLAGAVSPVMLSTQSVILAGRGRRAASRYAAGVGLTALAAVLATLVVGDSATLPRRPHLDASLDLVPGAVRHAARGPRSRSGGFSMATNVTTLALLVPAAKEIATADVTIAGRVALVLVVVSLISMPAWCRSR